MRTNLLLLGFLLVFGTIEAHPSQGQRFARQAEEEDSTEKMMMEDNVDEVVNNEVENVENKSNSITEKIMLDNADDIVNNEVENPELVKKVDTIVEYDTEVDVKIKTSEMMKHEMKPEVEDENEVPAVKVSASTTTTVATPTVAPLGVTLRAAPVTQRTTRRPAPAVVYTPAPTPAPTQAPSDPGLLGRLGNFLNSGIGNIGSSIGGNLISGGSLLAAAASPIWAPLLVGKKRRKRSGEDVKLNEIDQARSLQYYTKLIMSHIKQAKNKY